MRYRDSLRVALASATAVWLSFSAGTAAAQPLRILNHRGESVAVLETWADAVRRHVPGQFDPPAAAVGGWTREQLGDLEIELINLLVLMDNPTAKSFTAEDRRFRSSDV